MKKELLFGISLGIFLIVCIAMAGIVSAQDASGGCVELTWQCNGPDTEITHTACNVDICTACPSGTLVYQTKCTGVASDSTFNNLLNFMRSLVQTAMGKPTQLNPDPTAIERLTALTMVIIFLGCLLSLFAFPLKLLKHIFEDKKDIPKAPPSNFRPVKKSGNESEQNQQEKKPNMILLLIILVIFICLFALTYAGYIDFSNFGSSLKNFSSNLAWYSILIVPILIGIVLFYVAYRRKKVSKKL